jgi:CubicO group peptidase (beta-lactamase class C family)
MATSDGAVREALEGALRVGEVGVAVAAYLGDELVVDEWIGRAAEHDGHLVDAGTLFPVFSVTKAMTATALHLQADRGLVDEDAPVVEYWPEFRQQGKGSITIRHLLSHQSGMAAMPPDITPELVGDWDWITTRLAAMAPLHPPGAANAYHALSFGWLIGEVIRRTDRRHRLPCQFLNEEVLAPAGIGDLWLPLPPAQDHRVAMLTTAGAPQADFTGALFRDQSTPAAVAPGPAVYNRVEMRRACNPSAGAIATARDVARFFAILANGGTLGGTRLLSEERVRSCLQVRPDNGRIDGVAGVPTSLGIGGLWVRDPTAGGAAGTDASGLPIDLLVGPSRQVLYHTGAGGTIAFADLEQRLAVAICHNRMFGKLPVAVHPWVAVADAVRDAARRAEAATTRGAG